MRDKDNGDAKFAVDVGEQVQDQRVVCGSSAEVGAFPQMAVLGDSAAEMIDFINKSGLGVIGTPEECAAQIDRLVKQSNGGFGCYLLLGHNWANPQATAKSFELTARHVMPHFQGQAQSTLQFTEPAPAPRGP